MSKDAQIEQLTEEIKAARATIKQLLKTVDELTQVVKKGNQTYITYPVKEYRPYPYYPSGPFWYYGSTAGSITRASDGTTYTTYNSASSNIIMRSPIEDDGEDGQAVAV